MDLCAISTYRIQIPFVFIGQTAAAATLAKEKFVFRPAHSFTLLKDEMGTSDFLRLENQATNRLSFIFSHRAEFELSH